MSEGDIELQNLPLSQSATPSSTRVLKTYEKIGGAGSKPHTITGRSAACYKFGEFLFDKGVIGDPLEKWESNPDLDYILCTVDIWQEFATIPRTAWYSFIRKGMIDFHVDLKTLSEDAHEGNHPLGRESTSACTKALFKENSEMATPFSTRVLKSYEKIGGAGFKSHKLLGDLPLVINLFLFDKGVKGDSLEKWKSNPDVDYILCTIENLVTC